MSFDGFSREIEEDAVVCPRRDVFRKKLMLSRSDSAERIFFAFEPLTLTASAEKCRHCIVGGKVESLLAVLCILLRAFVFCGTGLMGFFFCF